MVKILAFLKKDWWKVLLIFALTFAQSLSSLYLPTFMSQIVNDGIPNGDTVLILRIGGIMLAVALVGIICQITARFISSRVAAMFSKNLRDSVFSKVEDFSLAEFDKFSTASLITRCTNDVTQIQNFLGMTLRMTISAPMMAIGGILMAIRYGQGLSWILIISCSAIIAVMTLNFAITVPKFKLTQKNVDRLNLVTRENLSGLRVIRAFNAEGIQNEKFDEANKSLTKLQLSIGRISAALQPMTMLIMNITTVLVLWLGSSLVQARTIQVGDLMAFIQYVMQIMFSFQMLSMTFIMIPRAMVSIKRITEVLATDSSIKDATKNDLQTPSWYGEVRFNDVSFVYPNALEPALNNISFTAKPGELTAIIGSTGSGKTTLVNLIPRLYDVTAGEILIDGVNIKNIAQKELRENIGYVPQKNMLFAGDINSNIGFGRDIDESVIEQSAQIAQASDFINNKEDGFKNYVAQGGSNISGGQKQRLAIARALAGAPKIYIFDDSFSSLDFQTESKLRSALDTITKNSTVILVTQRVSTIMNADQIIVLDSGEIVGIGKHKDLLKNSLIYYEIASSQLTKEELQ